MNKTLEYISSKFNLDLTKKAPIEILPINRRIMAQTLAELEFNLGAEVGVAAGEHSDIICSENPNLKLYCIDPWIKYHGYLDYKAERLNYFEKKAKETLSKYNCILMKEFSMDAVKKFADNSLDFVYIDAAHDFKNVAMDICEWTPKVRSGGIVYGHDFKWSKGPYQNHVKAVVPAYCYSHHITPWFILGETGHNDGMYKEGTRSWMFVRE